MRFYGEVNGETKGYVRSTVIEEFREKQAYRKYMRKIVKDHAPKKEMVSWKQVSLYVAAFGFGGAFLLFLAFALPFLSIFG